MGFDQIILDRISREAGASPKQTEATITLLEGEATVAFIARYRKEVTGNLDELQIRTISDRLDYYKNLLERRATILRSIEEQNKLTDELKSRILECYEKAELEDLYLPYKPKRKTKASLAMEKGLEPLAQFIYAQTPGGEQSIDDFAETFVSSEKQVLTKEEAVEGALHIVAEWISENLEIRKALREVFLREGMVVAKMSPEKVGQKTKYEMYSDFREPVAKIPSHRMLAIRRGVREQVLSFSIETDSEKSVRLISGRVIKDPQSPFAALLATAIRDSFERLLNPSLQSEVRAVLKARSDEEAIKVFEANLSNLLLSPPAGLIGVLGIDPGFRTGCKVAVVDETGKFLEQTTIFPTEPRKDIAGSERKLYRLVQKHNARAIAIGNGTGSRETDSFVREFIRKYQNGEPLGVKANEKPQEPSAEAPGSPTTEMASIATGDTASSVNGTPTGESVATGPENSQSAELTAGALEVAGAEIEAARFETASIEALLPETEPQSSREELALAAEALNADGVVETGKDPVDVAMHSSENPGSSGVESIPEKRHAIFSVIVNESGASVYSASESARQEFPKLDVTVRGAISIARRLQDPLAELVKIHPKSIGVGQYQHDVDQKRLKEGLEATVELCVNRVGVDINTASYELLRYCSGVNQRLSKSIVDYRNQHGKFSSRAQLLQVPGLGERTFEQAAGFLRIKGGDNPLDSTAVHPESYARVEKMAESVGVSVSGLIENSGLVETLELEKFVDEKAGLFTLGDIKQELLKPGRDPRDQFVVPAFREDVKEVSDLKTDMVLEGTVTNVTNFGAFIDIGVHQDGLVHVSELSNRFIHDPRDAVHVGEIVKVKVIGVDVAMKRVSLSIKALLPERKKAKQEMQAQVRQAKPQRTQPSQMGADAARPNSAVAKEPGAKKEQRPVGKAPPAKPKEMKSKPVPSHGGKPAGRVPPKPAPAKKVEPSPTSPLSFEEKIRLLQQKFGGIR